MDSEEIQQDVNNGASYISTQNLVQDIDDCIQDLEVGIHDNSASESSQPHNAEELTTSDMSLNKDVLSSDVHVAEISDEAKEPVSQESLISKKSEVDKSKLNDDNKQLLFHQELLSGKDEVKQPLSPSPVVTKDENIQSTGKSQSTTNSKASLSQSMELFSPESASESSHTSASMQSGVQTGRKLEVAEDLDQSKEIKRQKLETSTEDSLECQTTDGEKMETSESPEEYYIQYDFSKQPGQITGAWTEFETKEQNFLKGCKWSPDGSCILTNSDDNYLRLFNTPSEIYDGNMVNVPQMSSVLKMKVGETIYDYCWYPLMSSSDPATCCLISTSRCMPVHMWDAFTGDLICSYRSFDQADEMVAAHCVSFNLDGTKIYCGFNKTIRVFDVSRPGRDFQKRQTFAKNTGQPGIVSCIEHSPVDESLYAAGSYSRTIALYYEPDGELACCLKGQQGGVTHLKFSPDGTKLYSGGRKDPEILCWDLRNPGKILSTLNRQVETNQRIYFDLDSSGRYLLSGNQDGSVKVWDVLNEENSTTPEPMLTYQAHRDTVNGLSLHPSLSLLATASGQRHYPSLGDSDDSDSDDLSQTTSTGDYSLGLWWLGS